MSANEIRAIRERFNLNQGDLARLLRLGANTVSRWESGRNVGEAPAPPSHRMRPLPRALEMDRARCRPVQLVVRGLELAGARAPPGIALAPFAAGRAPWDPTLAPRATRPAPLAGCRAPLG
ncbi:MAG: helix-turn-helix domain-containing protein [Polyangiaceae bacterium]|nr:helix-turn-helix domain-containing protein [Polyangiaceae bacterium]